MAKGDNAGPVNSPQGAQAPKMDQYSVMHSIMERLGQGGAGMAGSVAPSFGGQTPPYLGGGDSGIIPNNGPGFGSGGSMGSPFGQYGHDFTPMGPGSLSIAPQSMMGMARPSPGMRVNPGPQQMLRRNMMGNNVS